MVKKFINFTLFFVLAVMFFIIISPYVFKYQKFFPKTLNKEIEFINSKLKLHYIDDERVINFKDIKINRWMNKYEFYKILFKEFSKYPGVYMLLPESNKSTYVLPFEIRFVDGEFVVINSSCDIEEGAVVSKIDNRDLIEYLSDFYSEKYVINENKQFFSRYIFLFLGEFLKKKRIEVEYKFLGKSKKTIVETIPYEEFIRKDPVLVENKSNDFANITIFSFNFLGDKFSEIFEEFENIAKNNNIKHITLDFRYAYDIPIDLSSLYMIMSFLIDKKTILFEEAMFKFGSYKYTYKNFGELSPNNVTFKNKEVEIVENCFDPIGNLICNIIKNDKLEFYNNYKEIITPWTRLRIYIPSAKFFIK
ncbi:hypothetical protein [Thermosipho globiformans]|uniref:hypothetical protein n=1 Tax=Thermosipho globiformans TaxID=380685 RepID=UPI000F8EBAA8|nr:hypothetical protein [Thermosipho globiformans]